MTPPGRPAVCLIAIGGVDPAGAAGLVRDCATAEALNAAPVLIGTAWTQQSRRGVRGFEARAPQALQGALAWALAEAPSGATAVKVGMVATPGLVAAIVAGLERFDGPVVFDPVLAATSGGSLFEGPAAELLPLVRRATLVTPNQGEAAALTGGRMASSLAEAQAMAQAVFAMGAAAVLLKGGHLPGEPIDLLVTADEQREFQATRLGPPTPRGTGCALATAIAVGLSRGQALPEAVGSAKAWLWGRIRDARTVGSERHLG